MSDGPAGGARRRGAGRPAPVWARLAVTMCAALLGIALLLPAAASQAATPHAAAPPPAGHVVTALSAAPSCVAPLGEYGGVLSFQLDGVDPLVVTTTGSGTLRIKGSYRNTSKFSISQMGYKFQRGDPLTSASQIRQQADHPCQQVSVINSGFTDLHGTLKAGATAGFTATVPITGDAATSLAITSPGVYPIMININATLGLPDGPTRARVGELHLMLTVLSVPGSSGGEHLPGHPASSGIPFNMLWPIVDRPHLGVNGVFTDDDLASEIGPGGRLTELVDALGASQASPQAITLVIDPMLLDELDRMTHGYWVVAKPGTPQPTLTPTLNKSVPTSSTTTTTSSPGQSASSESASSASSASESSASAPGGSQQSGSASGTQSESQVQRSAQAGQSGHTGHTGHTGETGQPQATATTRAGSSRQAPSQHDSSQHGTPGQQSSATAQGTPGHGPSEQSGASGTAGSRAPATGSAAQTPSGPGSGATATSGSGSGDTGTPAGATGSTAPTESAGTTNPAAPGPAKGPGPQPAGTVAGKGVAAATAFLAHLRILALTYHVLVLPYADPDAVALVRAHMTSNLATAVYRGRAIAARVLDQPISGLGQPTNLVTDIADPYGGALDDATLAAYRALGYRSVVLSADSVSGSPLGAVPLALDGVRTPALVSGASLSSDIGSYVYTGVPTDAATQVNLLAALLVTQHADQGSAAADTPMILTPGRDWAPNSDGIRYITSLLALMGNSGVVTGTPLSAISDSVGGVDSADSADSPGSASGGQQPSRTLRYPKSAQSSELSPEYLTSLQAVGDRIAVLQDALSASPGPEGADPAQILGPLDETLLAAVSASWRGSTDPDGPVLDTVTDTLDSLYAGVTIHRSSDSYTLASSNSPLLLTVQNTLPYQVTVGVSILGGTRVGLVTDDPGRVDIPGGPRTKQVKIDAQVSRSGTFTVYAQLRGPQGAPWGGAVPLTIASRAYGALTLVLMLVAGGVLVLMSAFRVHQRWRTSRARRAGEAGASSEDTAVTKPPDRPESPDAPGATS